MRKHTSRGFVCWPGGEIPEFWTRILQSLKLYYGLKEFCCQARKRAEGVTPPHKRVWFTDAYASQIRTPCMSLHCDFSTFLGSSPLMASLEHFITFSGNRKQTCASSFVVDVMGLAPSNSASNSASFIAFFLVQPTYQGRLQHSMTILNFVNVLQKWNLIATCRFASYLMRSDYFFIQCPYILTKNVVR